MPLFWELFGFRSWAEDDVDNTDLAVFDYMTKVCRQVAKDRRKAASRG
jgi:hypothetical protein